MNFPVLQGGHCHWMPCRRPFYRLARGCTPEQSWPMSQTAEESLAVLLAREVLGCCNSDRPSTDSSSGVTQRMELFKASVIHRLRVLLLMGTAENLISRQQLDAEAWSHRKVLRGIFVSNLLETGSSSSVHVEFIIIIAFCGELNFLIHIRKT